jgi:hypothetical protein
MYNSGLSIAQSNRNSKNPLNLGTFSQLSLRVLTGTLGPENILIGSSDLASQPNTGGGGFGGGALNNWFKVTITEPAWIIVTKIGTALTDHHRTSGGSHFHERIDYLQVGIYDLNVSPIEPRGIFQKDTVYTSEGIVKYYPYFDHVMGAGSDLYNTHKSYRVDEGNEEYFPLEKGSYLICLSSTLNEPLKYAVGLVLEFPETEVDFICEDEAISFIIQEDSVTKDKAIFLPSPLTNNTVIPTGYTGFALLEEEVPSAYTLEVEAGAVLLIGDFDPNTVATEENYRILANVADDEYFLTVHDHSRRAWEKSWLRDHAPDDPMPHYFDKLINKL